MLEERKDVIVCPLNKKRENKVSELQRIWTPKRYIQNNISQEVQEEIDERNGQNNKKAPDLTNYWP